MSGATARGLRAPGVARSGLVLLVTFSAAAIGAGLGRALLTTYLPVLLERIKDAPGLIGTVMLVNTAAGLAIPLVVGVWSDRVRESGHGRTLPFVLGGSLLAAGGLGAVALGHASSYLLLALAASVGYVGLNAVTTAHRALIPENFEIDERAAATGSEELAMLLGTLGGVVIGGVLIDAEGWAPFAVGALLLPLLALPTVMRMRGRERERERVEHPRRGLRYYLVAARRPGGRLLLAAQACWVLGYVGLPPFFVLYAKHVLDLRASSAALLLAGFGLLTGVAMLLSGGVRPERQRTALVAAAATMGCGLMAIAATSSVQLVATALVPVAIGFGVLTTLGFPAYSVFIPDGEEGAYSALYFSVRSVASAIAVPAAGWTIALTDSYRSLFLLGGVATLAAVGPLLALGPGGRNAGRVLRYAGFLAAATAIMLAGGLLVQHTEFLEADKELFTLLNGVGASPALVDRLLVDPHIQNYVILTALVGVAAQVWRGRGLRSAATVVAAALVAYAMVRACWALWERPRPQELLGIAPANRHDWGDYPSFPSGHVAVTTAIVASASLLVPRLRVVLWAYAAVIALTRITYGAHFPSDVFAGLVLGCLAGWTIVAVAERPAGGFGPALRLLLASRSQLLRRLARGLGLAAIAAFAVLALTEGPPASPEGGVLGAALERNLQIALLAVAAIGLAAAWWRDQLGAVLVVAGIGLGVLAALQYTPLFAVLACLAFLVPGVLFLFAWERISTLRAAACVGAVLTLTLAAGAFAALEVHDRAYGPAHPESPLTAPPTWRVQWIWAGGVTTDSVTVNGKLNSDGRVRLVVSPRRDLRGGLVSAPRQTGDDLGERNVSFTMDGLEPDTRYFYALEFDGRLDRNRIGTFRTFAAGRRSFKIAFSGCARVGSNGAVFDTIRAERPLLFLSLGDLFYANIEDDARGRFLDEFDRAVGSPAQGALYRSTPIAYVWDDHDYGGDGADGSSESRPAARAIYRQAVPHYSLPAGPKSSIEQAFTVGRVRFIVMDTRSNRTDKTMLGRRQLAWVERELLAARDRYRLTVLVSSVPWVERASPGAGGWGAFPAERARISRFIATHRIDRLLMLAGDAHMLAIDDGTHTDYSGTGRASFPLMHAGALDRPGHAKGGPYSEGAYPGAGQYGTMSVVDGPKRMRVALSGRDWRHREIVRYAFSVRGTRR